ncbi:MAG: DUF3426 domain-containing protein [Thermodesulfobacteriota bacterium]
MIITCASCLTKFNLDDSKISGKGAKVRCSRCQHVFYVAPPPETKEEIIENFESFAKYHEELMEPSQKEKEKEVKTPTPLRVKKGERVSEEEEEETRLFSEKGPTGKVEETFPAEPVVEERAEVEVSKPKRMVRKEKRGPSLFFVILVILILFVFGFFYLWTQSGTSGTPYSFLEYPIQKITSLWQQIWGSEKEGLIVRDLNGYDEQIGEVPLFVIEGKVNNQSRFTKKHIKIKVAIFDQDKAKLAVKETVCGRVIGREELKNLPGAFFKGEMAIRPKTEKEMITPPGKAIPFMVVFKNLSAQAKEFQVEIVEAPNL